MSRLTRPLVAALAAAALLAGAPRATAETINLTLTNGGNPVTYNPYGGAATTVGAGPFHWTQSAPINANFAPAVTTYCIDLDHYISTGNTYTYTVQPDLKLAPTIGNNTAKVGAITELFDRYYTQSLASTASASAFQLALWDLLYDGASRSLTAGRIQGNNAQAQSMLSSLGSGGYVNHDLAGSHLVALVSASGNQDQITVVPNPKAVPAPPGVVLAGMGVGGLLLGRFRRKA